MTPGSGYTADVHRQHDRSTGTTGGSTYTGSTADFDPDRL